MKKTFNQLETGDTIIIPGDPECKLPGFRQDREFTVEKKHSDETIKVAELGGVVVKMDEYDVKE